MFGFGILMVKDCIERVFEIDRLVGRFIVVCLRVYKCCELMILIKGIYILNFGIVFDVDYSNFVNFNIFKII